MYSNHALFDVVEKSLVAPLGWLATLGAWLAICAIPVLGSGSIVQHSTPLLAVCSGALVLLASFERNVLRIPGAIRVAMVWLGARSYSIYLVHMPVFISMQWLGRRLEIGSTPRGQIGWVAASTAVILLLSDGNFRWVETRFRQHSRPPRPITLA